MLFREGDGEVLDAVFYAESFKEDNEVAKVFDEVVIAFVGFEVAQEDYVVGEIEYPIGLCKNDKCGRECRVVRGEADAVTVLLIGHRRGCRSEVVGEIFLYFGECISQTLVGGLGLLCRRFNWFFLVVCLAAKDGFHTIEELIEVVGCFHFLLDLGFVWELSSLIFSSRRCFWSRARAVSCTRSS